MLCNTEKRSKQKVMVFIYFKVCYYEYDYMVKVLLKGHVENKAIFSIFSDIVFQLVVI